MREILFRGKRIDNGEWVGGDLIRNLIYDGREKEKRIGHIYFETGEEIHGTEVYNVIPETVGQYTGLTDRNGKKIFEGDIVSFDEYHYTVEWKQDRCGYGYAETADRMLECDGGHCEILGNIHDNPELLYKE